MKIELISRLAMCVLLVSGITTAFAAQSKGDEEMIKAALEDACKAAEARDHLGAMGPFQNKPGFLLFDFTPPRGKDYAKLDEDNTAFLKSSTDKPICHYLEIHPVLLSKDAAYSWSELARVFRTGR